MCGNIAHRSEGIISDKALANISLALIIPYKKNNEVHTLLQSVYNEQHLYSNAQEVIQQVLRWTSTVDLINENTQ